MNITLETGKFESAIRAEFDKKLFGVNVVVESINIIATFSELREHFSWMTIHQTSKNSAIFHNDRLMIECSMGVSGNHVTVEACGASSDVELVMGGLRDRFEMCDSYAKWVYDPQYLSSMNVPLIDKNVPCEEMYPWLKGESLVSYYNRFIASSCSILLLIGPPGTGKTSFLRDLLRKTRQNAFVTYHPKVLENEEFFAEWYQSSNEHIIIAEDADEILSPRSDGNKLMTRFLNLGDGLITMPNKKMIFTCNLTNMSDVDSALTRPGRCFDVVKFGTLDREQSKTLAKKFGIEFNLDGSEFTVSEIFNEKTKSSVAETKNKLGFM